MPGSVQVRNVNGVSVVVGLTTEASTVVPVFSDAACSVEVTLPVTITEDTTFYVTGSGGYLLSVTVGGLEIAGPLEVFLANTGPVAFAVDANMGNADVDRLVSKAGGGSVPSTVVHSFDVSADPSGINTALVAGVNTGIVIPAGSVVLPLLSLNLSIPVDWDGTSPGLGIGASQAEAVVNITTEPNNTIFNLNTFVNGPVGIGTGAHLQNTINQAITWYFPDDTTLWIALGVVGSGGDPGSTTGTAKLLVAYTPPAA